MSYPPAVEFDVMTELAQDLWSRFPDLTEAQRQEIGIFMLKALWLGKGVPLDKIRKLKTHPKPELRIVK